MEAAKWAFDSQMIKHLRKTIGHGKICC